jgi:hypothetical protein
MPMRKSKVLPSTGGGLMLTAVGLYASGWPEVIRLHPVIPLLTLLAGGALLVWGFYRTPKSNDAKIAAAIGRDNSGQQLNAGRDIKTEHHYYSHNLESLEKSREHAEVPRVEDSAPRQLRLRVDGIEIARLRYESDEGWWVRGDESDGKGLLIWITNDQAPVGQPNPAAKKLMALLQLRSCNRAYKATVSRAYWLETYFNQVDLEVGHRHAIIVGLESNDNWLSYENLVTFRQLTRFGINSYIELPNPSMLPKNECVRFEITLIEGRHQHSVFRCAFRINFPPTGGWDAIPIEESEL